jgi:hypothetical protein
MQTLAVFRDRLQQLILGPAIACDPLTIFPLSWSEHDEPPYALLPRAIENGTAVVEEISHAGSRSGLRLTNKALRPLLAVEGEVLVGAKPPRVVSLTVLVAAKSSCSMPPRP